MYICLTLAAAQTFRPAAGQGGRKGGARPGVRGREGGGVDLSKGTARWRVPTLAGEGRPGSQDPATPLARPQVPRCCEQMPVDYGQQVLFPSTHTWPYWRHAVPRTRIVLSLSLPETSRQTVRKLFTEPSMSFRTNAEGIAYWENWYEYVKYS